MFKLLFHAFFFVRNIQLLENDIWIFFSEFYTARLLLPARNSFCRLLDAAASER